MKRLRAARIAVIGAGVSGSFLAYLLSLQNRAQIFLFEKKSLDNSHVLGKVCGGCLHKDAEKILVQYGLVPAVDCGIPIRNVSLYSPERITKFNYQHGKWINRKRIDNTIRKAAENVGVSLINQQAKIINSTAGIVQFAGREENFDLVINCTGISGKSLPEWPTQEIKDCGFGFQGYLKLSEVKHREITNIMPGEVRFFIDDCGYHGVVRVDSEQPYFHIASYLYGSKLQTSDFLNQFFQLENLHEKAATETLYRKRLAARGKVFLCGDSLGYPEPFTGEGMYFAIQTAERLAQLILKAFPDNKSCTNDLSEAWIKEVEILQNRQWARCQTATWAINSPLKRKLFFPLIPYLAPLSSRVW